MAHFTFWLRCIIRFLNPRRVFEHGIVVWRALLRTGMVALALLLLSMAQPPSLAAPLLSDRPADSSQAQNQEAFPSYVGLDAIHVSYSYVSTCPACRRELQVVLPNGTVGVLATLASGSVTDSFYHAGLIPGQYGYRIVETRLVDDKPIYTTTLRSGTVDGVTIGGAMLFNETLSDAFACESLQGVTVRDGNNLVLDGASLISNCQISLEGTASLSAQSSDFLGGTLSIGGAGTADIVGSTFGAPIILSVGPEVVVNITQSYFSYFVQIAGSARALRFQNNALR